MAKDLNICTLIGRLTRDVELKVTNSGVNVCSFSIANNGFKDDQVNYINVVAWRGTAEFVAKYIKKGNRIAVSGALQTRTYEASDGGKRTVTEIVASSVQFLESKPQNANNTQQENPFKNMSNPLNPNGNDPFANNGGSVELDDDSLPF